MPTSKVAAQKPADSSLFILDSAAILEGANLVASRCRTTPEVVQEIRAGGATGRRLEQLVAAGLVVQSASPQGLQKVKQAATAAGNLSRLSAADRSILALASDHPGEGLLLSDDYTVLDVARRMDLRAQSLRTAGPASTLDWVARCRGCGRSYGPEQAGGTCPVCGQEILLKPKRGRGPA